MKREIIFKLCSMLLSLAMVVTLLPVKVSADTSSDKGNGTYSNPVIYADVPDVSVIRVGKTFYMASTTMHMSPGVPIMKSTDLVNWEIVNYVYDRIGENNEANLANGKNMYGKGSWAASLKYNAGTYYCSFMSYTTGKTYIYQTKDIENGSWTKYEINGTYHDMSLLFDTDGRVYMLYGGTQIKYVELNSNATGIKYGGASGTLFDGSRLVGQSLFEGTQATKINGYYYVFNIAWPSGKPRSEYCSRSKSLNGPWEHKVVLQTNFQGAGVAQGSIVDTADGKWYGMMFKDNGSVGRSPVLCPVTWQNDWPILGSNGTSVSASYPIPISGSARKTIVKSDEFDGTSSGKTWTNGLGLVWQWNHNPDNNNWSITQRPGYLRLKTGMTTNVLTSAKNTLTQRTYGPSSSGKICIDVTNMKNGDVAGLTALAYNYGYVGVKMNNGSKQIVMVNAPNSSPKQIEAVNINTNKVYLKIDCSFGNGDRANFYYSTDGNNWKKIGNTLNMVYDLNHFMGYRFGLFNYATQQTGGYVDFDYFRVSDQLKGAAYDPSGDSVNPSTAPEISTEPSKDPVIATGNLEDGLYYIKNVNAQKYLQVKDNLGNAGQNIEIGTGTGAAGQKWYLTNTADGYITLTSSLGNYMVDIDRGSATDGANIQIYNGYSGDSQKFLVQKTSTDGVYTLATKVSNGTKNFDVYDHGKTDGTNVCQWAFTGNPNQQWIFEKVNAAPAVSTVPSQVPSTEPSKEPSKEPETQEPVQSAEPSKEPATATGITYKYSVVSDWGSGFQGELVVTNNSTKTYNGWNLIFDYNSTISSLWGAELAGQSGTKVTVKNPSWAASFAPGQSVTINFVANTGSDKNAPTNYVFS